MSKQSLSKKTIMQIHSALLESKKQKTPVRSRSRSRSRPRTPRLNTVAKKRSRSENKKNRNTVMAAVAAMKPLKIQHSVLSRKLEGIKKGYFAADAKDTKTDGSEVQKQIDALEREMALVKNTLRAGMGDKPIRVRLTATLTMTTTVTSGVTNTVSVGGSGTPRIQPASTTEFSTLAALFDEYKCTGGKCDFIYVNTINPGVDLATNGSNNLPVISYDPADVLTPAASSSALTEMAHHEVMTPITASTYVSFPGNSIRHKFNFKVPPGSMYTIASGATTVGNIWVSTDQTVNVGSIKFYHIGQIITAIDTGKGFIYMDCEFRCRE